MAMRRSTGTRGLLPALAAMMLAVPGGGPGPLAAQDTQGPSPVGTWEGQLATAGSSLAIVFHIREAEGGGLEGELDSPDQGATGIPASQVTLDGRALTLEVASIGGRWEGELSEAGDRLEGTWSQSGMEVPLDLERVEEVSGRQRPQEPGSDPPYDVEEIRYPNPEAGFELAGTLTRPRTPGPHPAAVLISGSGPQDRDEQVFGHRPFLVLADALTRRGIAVLRFDDRGVGASSGDFGSATTEDFVGDALAGVAWLATRPEVDLERIGLIGHSEGALVAPLAAGRSDRVSWIVLIAPPGVPGDELLYAQAAAIARAGGAADAAIARNRAVQERLFRVVRAEDDPAARRDSLAAVLRGVLSELSEEEREALGLAGSQDRIVAAQAEQLSTPWFRFFLTHDPIPALRRVDVPVLAVGGSLDLQVPAEENLRAVEQALEGGAAPRFTVRVLPGLNHLLQPAETGLPAEYARIETTMDAGALTLIADWILSRDS